jgi:hypothetical protein
VGGGPVNGSVSEPRTLSLAFSGGNAVGVLS